jgi:hypothetical protein
LAGLSLGILRGVASKNTGGRIMGAVAAQLLSYIDSWRYDNGVYGQIQANLLPIIDSAIGCSSGGAVKARRSQNIPSWRYIWEGNANYIGRRR